MNTLINNSDSDNYSENTEYDSSENVDYEFITVNLPKGLIGVILGKTDNNEILVDSFRENTTVSHILQIGDILYSINNMLIYNSSTKDIVQIFNNNKDKDRVLVIKRFKISPIIHGYIENENNL